MAQETTEPQGRSGRPKWMGYAQLVLILAAIGVALYFAQAPSSVERDPISDLAPEQTKPTVAVIQPAPTEHALTVNLTGGVTLHGKVKVTSEVGGRVVWVSPNFRNGGSIAANETIIRIDPAQYELELEAAAAKVAKADARVQIENAEGEAPRIARAEAALKKAQAEMKLAQLQLARTEISLPYDSRVVAADIDVGQFVGPAELVGRASSLGSVYRTDAIPGEGAHRAGRPGLPRAGHRPFRHGPHSGGHVRGAGRAHVGDHRTQDPSRDTVPSSSPRASRRTRCRSPARS